MSSIPTWMCLAGTAFTTYCAITSWLFREQRIKRDVEYLNKLFRGTVHNQENARAYQTDMAWMQTGLALFTWLLLIWNLTTNQ